MSIVPQPTAVATLSQLTPLLDNLTHPQRLAWVYGLDEREQLALFELAEHETLSVSDLVGEGQTVVIHPGRNGLPMFNRFQKRFARLGDEVVGYNHNDTIGGPLNFIARRLIGPGHFLAYDHEDHDVWIDYRRVPSRRHPEFPPLLDNDHGIRALVFGNMVDVLRRASRNVFIGNAYKDKSAATTLLSKLGSKLPTAPFVLVQP